MPALAYNGDVSVRCSPVNNELPLPLGVPREPKVHDSIASILPSTLCLRIEDATLYSADFNPNNGEKQMAQPQRIESDSQVETTVRRPVDTARHGNVEIAIWRNPSSKGDFYSASSPTIRYKDEAGQWKDSSSFGRHDLLDLAEAAREAATKIRDRQKERSQEQSR